MPVASLRDLHSNLAAVAVNFCRNGSAALDYRRLMASNAQAEVAKNNPTIIAIGPELINGAPLPFVQYFLNASNHADGCALGSPF
jgi:hypothetical protein